MASLRPRAYICVFSDDPVVKRLTALNFGVYTFPVSLIKNPEEFIATAGSDLIMNGRAKILKLETDDRNKFVSYKVIRVGYWFYVSLLNVIIEIYDTININLIHHFWAAGPAFGSAAPLLVR